MLEIKKEGSKNFWHYAPELVEPFSASDLFAEFDGNYLKIRTNTGRPIGKKEGWLYTDIRVYDVGGTVESFGTAIELNQRLIDLGYIAFYEDNDVLPSSLISNDPNNSISILDGLLYSPPQGTAVNGLPEGGTTSQKLVKSSNNNFDAEWVDDLETTLDTEMSDTSENGVQNKVIKAYVDSNSGGLDTNLIQKFTVNAVQDNTTPLTSAPIDKIGVEFNFDDDNTTAFLFNEDFSGKLNAIKELIVEYDISLNIYNNRENLFYTTLITSFDVVGSYIRANVRESIANVFLVNDVLDFSISTSLINSGGGSSYQDIVFSDTSQWNLDASKTIIKPNPTVGYKLNTLSTNSGLTTTSLLLNNGNGTASLGRLYEDGYKLDKILLSSRNTSNLTGFRIIVMHGIRLDEAGFGNQYSSSTVLYDEIIDGIPSGSYSINKELIMTSQPTLTKGEIFLFYAHESGSGTILYAWSTDLIFKKE